MIKKILNKQTKNILKELSAFLFSGLIFIFVAKASMNFELFLANVFSIFFIEAIFLLISFFAYTFLFIKIKNILLSYILYFLVLGFSSVFLIEYLYNKNTDFPFFGFIFLFILKGVQLTFARIFIDRLIDQQIKKSFLKRFILFYFVYIFIGLLGFFAFSSVDIWSLGFVLLLFLLFFLFLWFLFRIKFPRKIIATKTPYKDVTFY